MYSMRFVFDRKGITKSDPKKKALVQIEVFDRETRKKVYLSTGIRLLKNQYSNNGGFSIKGHPNAITLKASANSMYNKVEAFIASDKCKYIDDVKNWNKDDSLTTSVVDFMRAELRKSKPSDATLEHHNVLIRKLEEFGKIKTFADINYTNICEFDYFLKRKISSSATLNKRHTTFRKYISKAVYMELCKKNPYDEFKMPSKKSKDPTYLEEFEINKILAFKPDNDKLQKVKDLFIMQMFTGMAYIDLQQFSKEEYISELDGVKIISNERVKTGEPFIALFLPQAENIADKYDYKLPKISNQKYNDYLKLLAVGSGIKKNLTSHVARHTFATYLINKDVPINSVSKALGHSSIKMTEHYAKLLGKTVINDMKKLL